MTFNPNKPIEVFYSYAHEDEALRDELNKHLANLKRQGIITDWYDRNISGGREWDNEIKCHLDSATVILLLISPDFMDSEYINAIEVTRAMERHESGEARVIPVILRPVDWLGAPFSKLQALPTDGEPVTKWVDRDEAFLDITKGIRKAIQEISGPSAEVPTVPEIPRPPKVGFVGRRDKNGNDIMRRLRMELTPERNQLVALWGAGGVGKTTLAAETVRTLAEFYGQRIIWISAEGRPNFAFSTLLDEIAESLGRADLRSLAQTVKEEALQPLIDARPTLVVLDNFETIAPEEELICKEFLSKRLRCPALITTRERIGDAVLLPLAAMAPDEAQEFVRKLILQSPDSEIYALVDLEQILKTAEYNPLIIRWIVAQIDLAQDPDEVLKDLSRGEGDAAERVFDRSFTLPQMADGGRAVLLALSLFVPSASRPALAEVAGMATEKDRKKFRQAQQTLGSLWLVKQIDGGQRLAVEGLTRELTRAHLDSDPRFGRFRQRFVFRFLKYTISHAEPTISNLNALQNERENILTAIDIACESKNWTDLMAMVSVIAPTNGFLGVRGYWDEAIKRNEQAKAAAISVKDEVFSGLFLLRAGNFQVFRGDYEAAHLAYSTALSIFRTIGDETNVSAALHNLATLAHDRGQWSEARKLYNSSLEIDKKLGSEQNLSTCLLSLGKLAKDEGKIAKARRLYNESLEISKRIEDSEGIAACLHSLATIAQEEERFEDAGKLYEESLQLSKKRGDRSGIATSMHGIATIALAEGENEKGSALLKEVLAIGQELGEPRVIAFSLKSLGMLRLRQKRFEEAKSLLAQSLTNFRKLNFGPVVIDCLRIIGDIQMEEKNFPAAVAHYREALELAKILNQKSEITAAQESLRLAKQAWTKSKTKTG